MIKIKEMIEIIRESFKDEKIFYNKKENKLIDIDEYYLCIAKGEVQKKLILSWQKELVALGRDIIENGEKYIECPNRKAINEFDLMHRFINEKLFCEEREEILHIIDGPNPLKRFKSAIEGVYFENIWDIFIDEELEKICIKWCEEWEIKYEL
ncbi:MAG: UPF0158 family protein [Clostridium sp.]